jgi:hypothetical protein
MKGVINAEASNKIQASHEHVRQIVAIIKQYMELILVSAF